MNNKIFELLDVQGEIKIRLMQSGLLQEEAHGLACNLLDYIARSPITSEEHRQAYFSLDANKTL